MIKQYKSVEWWPLYKSLEQLMLEHDKLDILQIFPIRNKGMNEIYRVVLVRTEQEEQTIADLPETGTDIEI